MFSALTPPKKTQLRAPLSPLQTAWTGFDPNLYGGGSSSAGPALVEIELCGGQGGLIFQLRVDVHSSSLSPSPAKATFAAIARTYTYLTPDLWQEAKLTKSPFQEFTDYLSKTQKIQPLPKHEES